MYSVLYSKRHQLDKPLIPEPGGSVIRPACKGIKMHNLMYFKRRAMWIIPGVIVMNKYAQGIKWHRDQNHFSFFFFSFRIPSYSNRRFQIIVYEVRSMYAVCLPSRSPTEDSVCTRTRTRNLCNYWYIQKGAFILFSASMAIVDNLFFVLSSMFRSIYQSAMNRT